MLISLRQAAQILSVTQRQVARIVKAGEIPAHRFGDSQAIFVDDQDVKDYQARHPKWGRLPKQDKR